MRRVLGAIAVVALGCGPARSGGDPERGVDAVSWLTGCWRYTSPRGTVVDEQWRRAAADTMAGVGVTSRDGVIVESEIMHIARQHGSLIFSAQPSGQTRTEFRSSVVAAERVTFENPQHDFPQRVSYRAAGDSLYARIDGIVNGSERVIDFPMGRVDCPD